MSHPFPAIAGAVLLLGSLSFRASAYTAECKTVTVNSGTAASSPLATRLYLDAGVTPAPIGTTVWFVADRNGDGVPTAPSAQGILGSDDEVIFRDVLDGDQPGSTAGRYRRLDITVPDSLRTAAIYLYVWNGTGAAFTPVTGSTFGLFRFGVVPPPDVGNAPWLVNANVNASEFRVGGTVANRPPVFAGVPTQTATNGVPASFTVSAVDPDAGQTLSYSLAPGSPSGASVDASSGLFRWTPGVQDVGTNHLAFRATDSGNPSQSATLEVVLVVKPTPVPPPSPVLAVNLSTGNFRIQAPSITGASYQLQVRTDLVSGGWENLGETAAGSGSLVTFDLPLGADSRRFFRIVAQ